MSISQLFTDNSFNLYCNKLIESGKPKTFTYNTTNIVIQDAAINLQNTLETLNPITLTQTDTVRLHFNSNLKLSILTSAANFPQIFVFQIIRDNDGSPVVVGEADYKLFVPVVDSQDMPISITCFDEAPAGAHVYECRVRLTGATPGVSWRLESKNRSFEAGVW